MTQTASPGRLLKIRDVVRETSLGKSTIYRRIDEGTFPRSRSIGPGRVAWPERDIEAWKNRTLEEAGE